MTEKNFGLYSRYYDLLYQDKDYNGEADYIHGLLSRYGVTSGDLLEFGSGTGKHGRLLALKGYNVHGIELSPAMVANAEVGRGFSCEQGDISSAFMGRQYDAVLSLFHVVSYQTADDQLQAVFSNAARHLKHGGLFIFDFWYSPAVYTQKPAVRVKRMENGVQQVTRIAEPTSFHNENRVDVNYTIYTHDLETGGVDMLRETHPMRHFSLPEIELLASTQGFDLIASEEFLTATTPSESTWSVGVILKKVTT